MGGGRDTAGQDSDERAEGYTFLGHIREINVIHLRAYHINYYATLQAHRVSAFVGYIGRGHTAV